jgi:hypothetical protein
MTLNKSWLQQTHCGNTQMLMFLSCSLEPSFIVFLALPVARPVYFMFRLQFCLYQFLFFLHVEFDYSNCEMLIFYSKKLFLLIKNSP